MAVYGTKSILLLSLFCSLNVSAQHHGHHPPPPPPPGSVPAVPPGNATVAPAPVTSSVVDTDTATAAPTAGTESAPISSQPLTSAAPPITATSAASAPSSTSGSGGGGGGSCTGSGMEIQWSGDEVSFSWSGGSGTTTGCTSLGSDFQGQVAVGGEGGTIFEGNPSGFFDVSYILGYSVPMMCSSGDNMKSGCSKDLFGNGGKAGQIKQNPTGPGGAHDPGSYNGCATCSPWCWACSAADPFFAPCSGSAYTYPKDDGASVGPATGTINCCIGTSCGSTGREGSTADGVTVTTGTSPCTPCGGGSKRSVDELENVFRRYEAESAGPASSSPLLPRRRKAHKHHAVAHEAKILR
ncbi:hypothetical protein ACLMJK_003620 [Lecanora helva]